jgi:hypothetical protein
VLGGGTGCIRVDGQLAGTRTIMTLTPASLGTRPNNSIGKPEVVDPYLDRNIDDFRV